jgi:hypothetical protein
MRFKRVPIGPLYSRLNFDAELFSSQDLHRLKEISYSGLQIKPRVKPFGQLFAKLLA